MYGPLLGTYVDFAADPGAGKAWGAPAVHWPLVHLLGRVGQVPWGI